MDSKGYAEKVTPICASMSELPIKAHSFDAILVESCVYIMGFEEALKQWQPVLKADGLIIVSDLVWLTSKPNEKYQSFWSTEYPAMSNVDTRLVQAKKLGFEVLDDFTISDKAWQNYLQPLQARVNTLKASMPESQAIKDIQRELDIYQSHYGSQFGYHFFLLRRNAL
nr:methyltransferase domain-containing protein [Pseudoalteromonas phenolica]